MLFVEQPRQQLTFVDLFWRNKDVDNADLVRQDDIDLATEDRRHGTDTVTGRSAARKAAKKGPVYIMDQEDVNPSGLHEAGFATIRVEGRSTS